MKFNYQARTKTGEIQTGTIEASSKETAVSILQRYGLYVTFLEKAEEVPLYARRVKFFESISQKELVLFFRQLSIMSASKVPLVEALRTLANQTSKVIFREKILKISDEIEGGTSLSSALSRYPAIFSPFYIAMVRSGEASGKLSEALSYLAEHLEREYHFLGRVKAAMIYPALVLLFTLVVVILMIFVVVPQMSGVLKEIGQELPMITQIVLTVSEFLRKWGLIFLSAFFIFIGFLIRFYSTQEGKEFFDRFFLKIPLAGDFLKLIYLSRFAENLSTLISGGLPIAQCLEISGKIVGNSVYQGIIFQARDEVRRGEQISRVLARFPEAFPPVFTQMTLVGEKTGTLDKTLMNLVTFYQKEIERIGENLPSILEPLLIILSGAVVGGVIAAFLIPIYQMAASL